MIEALVLALVASMHPLSGLDHVDPHLWFSLPQKTRDEWEKRLRQQWGLRLTDTREFWFNGSQIIGVVTYERNSEGHRYLNKTGNGAATKEFGVVPLN